MRILLTGGGTGGHVMPVLAVVKAINDILPAEPQYLWVGSRRGLEGKLAAANKIPFKSVATGKLRRYFSFFNIIDVCKIPLGMIQSFFVIGKFGPDVIFSKGGYVSVPVVVAGWLWRAPIITHESDIIPGLANKIIARLARKIAVSFPRTGQYFSGRRVLVTGNPLRAEILAGNKVRAREKFNLAGEKPVILVVGGSQGAQKLNKVLLETLPRLLENYQVLHVCGQDNYQSVRRQVKEAGLEQKGYSLQSFLSAQAMGDALALADLVITRAGINTLNEIAAWGKPALIVPIGREVLGEHQEVNAKYFREAGAAAVLPDSEVGAERLVKEINDILANDDRRQDLGRKMAKLAHREAAEKLADQIIALARGNKHD
ncbi:MAG: undecaprenyldiphospho-muramoylpentapeptide beta-N-acetylglucosaminyltransferase [Parcubacteria group bacterium]|nr:undecaprenyldiphospho-muramoylpentapeptide beta-N-acetylglucosaminyltransferase [Parcubacteria group bacterium]